MPEPVLYLFDGYNLLHAGEFADPRELRDLLASFVALQGARGVVVFDGVGELVDKGPLRVEYAPHADAVLERLAAENRATQHVILVSSDAAVRGTSGIQVQKLSSRTFLADLEPAGGPGQPPSDLRDRLDAETLARLERLRRGN
jgi:predicted RNA-binding protein with PIN domain